MIEGAQNLSKFLNLDNGKNIVEGISMGKMDNVDGANGDSVKD